MLCVIETIRCIYWNRLNNCHCFLEKGRTLSKYSIAQKTPKNKRVKLLRKRNRKLFFLEIIRGISSPKYFRKTKPGYFSAKQFLLCVIETIRLVMESPKYSPFFFWKKENPGELFCLNIADLDFSNTFCITLCATLCYVTFGPGRRSRPSLPCTYATPRVGVANRRPPYPEMSRISIFQYFLYFLLYILFYAFIHSFA